MPEVLTKISDLTTEQKSHLVTQMMGTTEGRMHMAHLKWWRAMVT